MAAGAGGSFAGDGMVVWPRAEEIANERANMMAANFMGTLGIVQNTQTFTLSTNSSITIPRLR